jgi:branched-chain amino acid transport system ATP-binding protein
VTEPLLRVDGLVAYHGQLQAVRGVSFEVGAGEALAVIGENGAGKTTVFHSLCGLHDAATGDVAFAGERLLGAPAHAIVRRGIALVPEGRRIFPSLSVDENLRVAEDQHRRAHRHAAARWTRDRVYELFPDLAPASRRGGHQISGGQQQMLAIGRALLAQPRVLLMDEPCLGLAPKVGNEVYEVLRELRAEGQSIVIVEESSRRALDFVDRACVIKLGTKVLEDRASTMKEDDRLVEAYFGIDPGIDPEQTAL